VIEHEKELPPAEARLVRRDAEEVQAELLEADPDTGRIQDALRRISNRAATVLPIAGAAAEVLNLFLS
jgi:hypothetical protein